MRNLTLTILVYLFSLSVNGQQVQTAKDFIRDRIMSSNFSSSAKNVVLFSEDTLSGMIQGLCDKNLSPDEFRSIFVYGFEQYLDDAHSKMAGELYYCVDIRGIEKISTSTETLSKSGRKYSVINVFIKSDYLATSKFLIANSNAKRESPMKINVGYDSAEAKRIKNAIIDLAKGFGVSTVIDLDNLYN